MTVPPLRSGSLVDLRLNPHRWDDVEILARGLVSEGTLPALAIQVVRDDLSLAEPIVCGHGRLDEASRPALPYDAIFLIASITKPVVAIAVMRLVERGLIALNDRVVDLLPEFDAAPRRLMTIRHLLTHTSGLPDMLPNNRQLREANRPFSAFFDGTCAVSLDFPPGHGTQYQSMGFVLLAEIIHRVSGLPCREFVAREILSPLQMDDSSLGAPDDWFEGPSPTSDRIVEVRVPREQKDGPGWNWNSRYWRQFGAPWGGMLASVNDIARLCHAMITRQSILAPATARQMSSNQLVEFASVPEVDRRTRAWGLGWRTNWLAHPATFGDLLGRQVVGHWGATGTLCWIDRQSRNCCVILSSQPLDRGRNHLVRLSNAIVAAMT